MPDAMTQKKPPSLSPDAVAAWLKDHPDFFQKHPDVLDKMAPPKQKSGKGVADFQYYMVQRLKADRDEVLESTREIVENSRANMNNQARVHKAILLLLESRSFEDFIRTITMDFAALLDVDIISLAIEASGKVIPQITLSGVRALPPGSIAQLTEGQPVLLEAGIAGLEALYGGGARLVKSQALVRLDIGPDAPAALLAFGSRDPSLFHAGQGTELISFMCQAIARMMNLWLDTDTEE